MITPAYAITATERILPRLSLNFMAGALDSKIAFTRALNTATRVNSSGLVEIVNANVARFDYDPVTLAAKGLLIEETRSNIVNYSDDFANTAWLKLNATITSNAITAPDGTNTADKLVETVADNVHIVYRSPTVVDGAAYTLSVYAKAAERNWLFMFEDSGSNGNAWFNLSTGTIGTTGSGTVATMTNAGNGWYRCSITYTQPGTTGRIRYAVTINNAVSEYAGNGTSGIYIWGAQLEAGNFLTSYIPTVDVSLTRNADVAVMTGTNFSSWWTAVNGAVAAKYIPGTVSGIRPIIEFDDGTANESIALRGNTTNPELYIVDGGSDQAQIDAGTIASNTIYTLVGAWNTNSCAAAINGNAVVADNTATMPTVTQARFGCDGTNYLNGWIQTIRYWPQRIINAEVQAFSK